MARKLTTERAEKQDLYQEGIQYYKDALSQFEPPRETAWEPVRIGPSWQRDDDGLWKLPEKTLGWAGLGWTHANLQHSRGEPWRFTLEQARLWLWWYAVDPYSGRFVYRDAVLQRLKGWGKDPFGACLCANELLGPCRFLEWDEDGDPVATDHKDAWVQTAAVSLEQTKNTMRLFPSLFTAEAKATYGIQIGKETIWAMGSTRFMQAVTSSPTTLEGGRATFVLLNETHHWKANNDGHLMAAVIERNTTKSADGGARTMAITNAYEPGEDSVAEQSRDHHEKVVAGDTTDTGLLYDSLEAPPEAPLSAEAAPGVVESIRGDSIWLQTDSIVKSILDSRNPASRSRRFWYNQVTAAEDAWVSPQEWDVCADDSIEVLEAEEIVAFFDGSKSDDATGLVGCRVSDGHIFTLGSWQKPKQWDKSAGPWVVPRDQVSLEVASMFAKYKVLAFFCDPGSGEDDETGERFWDPIIDGWGQRYSAKVLITATGGVARHPFLWDMRKPSNQNLFVESVGRTLSDILEGNLTHDGSRRLRQHVVNARRRPGKFGVSIGKEHRESSRKIDLAVCAIGARMTRRILMNSPEWTKRQRRSTGKGRVVVWT